MYYPNLANFIISKVESTDPEDTIEAVCSALHDVPVVVVRAVCDYVLACLSHAVGDVEPDTLLRCIQRASDIHAHVELYR